MKRLIIGLVLFLVLLPTAVTAAPLVLHSFNDSDGASPVIYRRFLGEHNQWGAQSFEVQYNYLLDRVSLYLKKGAVGAVPGDFTIYIRYIDPGTGMVNDLVDLGQATYDGDTLGAIFAWTSITLDAPVQLYSGTSYAIVFRMGIDAVDHGVNDYVSWGWDLFDPYDLGYALYKVEASSGGDGAWHSDYVPGRDFAFRTYSNSAYEVSVTTNAATGTTVRDGTLNANIDWVNNCFLTGEGFVIDTVSHGDPGDVDPGSSGYAHYTYLDGGYTDNYGTWDAGHRDPGFVEDGALTQDYGFYDGYWLDPNTEYFVRVYAETSAVHYAYGGEVSFITDNTFCTKEFDIYGSPTDYAIWFGADPISTDIWGAENIVPTDNWTVTDVSLLVYRSGNVSHLTVTFYLADIMTWYPVGPALATGTVDVSTITTDNHGEWVDIALNVSLDMDATVVYDMVLTSDATFAFPGDMDSIVWVTTEDGPIFNYMYTYDAGVNWSWPMSDGVFELWECPDCTVPTLVAPQNLVATPVTGTETDLSWWSGNPDGWLNVCGGGIAWPNLLTIVRMEAWEYPDDPPSVTDGSTLVYQAPEIYGESTTTVAGLTPGSTYYFRVWFYDTDGIDGNPPVGYTTYAEDYATTLSGTDTPDTPDEPDEWSQDPTCDLYMHLPIITVMNHTADDMGMPRATMCLIVTMVMIGLTSAASYPLARLSGQPTSRTIVIPVMVTVVLVFVAAIVHAVPLMFIMFALVLGAGGIYLWTRA